MYNFGDVRTKKFNFFSIKILMNKIMAHSVAIIMNLVFLFLWPDPIERSTGYVSLILRLALVFEWPA